MSKNLKLNAVARISHTVSDILNTNNEIQKSVESRPYADTACVSVEQGTDHMTGCEGS